MISNSGWTTFDTRVKKLGGLEKLTKTTYMRNMWFLMKSFNVLPTNEDFRELTDDQIDMMILSVNEDNIERERASKGLSVDSDHYDESFEDEVWTRDVGDWEVVKEGHDPDDIANQIEALTKEEDLKNLSSKFDSLDEYNEYLESGGKTTRESEVEEYINRQIKMAEEKAQAMEMNKQSYEDRKKLIDDREATEVQDSNTQGLDDLDKQALEESIKLFNGEDDEDDDDEYTLI